MKTATTEPQTLIGEDLLSLSAAAKLLPHRRGGRRHASTIYRYIVDGFKLGRGGDRVWLEGYRMPDGWVTSRQALDRFFIALTDAAIGDVERERVVRQSRPQRLSVRAKAATAYLDSRGM